MKIHILYDFKEGPWGGGNQFLKALRSEFERQEVSTADPSLAGVIIANANPNMIPTLLQRLPGFRAQSPAPAIILRIDGPIGLVRGKDHFIDQLLKQIARRYVDGIIWQSQWSREANLKLGFSPSLSRVVHNVPDGRIFYPQRQSQPTRHRKIKLVAVSWSPSPRKGFDIYQCLDTHLDWSRYEMTFVGNTTEQFEHIDTIAPVDSPALAKILRAHDIFITGSQHDPCSNALLEALACGLLPVIRNSGGHPELAPTAVRFDSRNDVLAAIDAAANLFMTRPVAPPARSLSAVAQEYLEFATQVQKSDHRSSTTSSHRLQAVALGAAYRGYQLGKLGGKYIRYAQQ